MKEHVFSYRNRLQQSYRIWYILYAECWHPLIFQFKRSVCQRNKHHNLWLSWKQTASRYKRTYSVFFSHPALLSLSVGPTVHVPTLQHTGLHSGVHMCVFLRVWQAVINRGAIDSDEEVSSIFTDITKQILWTSLTAHPVICSHTPDLPLNHHSP